MGDQVNFASSLGVGEASSYLYYVCVINNEFAPPPPCHFSVLFCRFAQRFQWLQLPCAHAKLSPKTYFHKSRPLPSLIHHPQDKLDETASAVVSSQQHAAAGLMRDKDWVRLTVFLVLVFVFCRVFVAENVGVLLGGAAVLGLGIYATLLAELPHLGSGARREQDASHY